MKKQELANLSILSCTTGLTLVAVFFASDWLGRPIPQWLPLLISAIAGFEIFMVIDALRRRRAEGDR